MKKIIPGMVLWSLLWPALLAQEYLSRDSLLRLLEYAGQDTGRVLLYISLGQQYENNDPDSALYYYQQARDLSERLDYKLGLIKYISNITYLYNAQSKYDTALSLNLQSVELAREHGTPLQLAACLGNVANSYLYLEWYENAIEYFLQADKVISRTGNKQYQSILYNNLAVIYLRLKQPGKAMQYARQAVDISRETEDLANLGISLDNLALTFIESNKPDHAIAYLEKALDNAEATENLYLKGSILLHFAEAYQHMGNYDSLRIYAEKSLQLARDLDDSSGEAAAYLKLGYYYLYRDRLSKARELAHASKNISISGGLRNQQADAHLLLGWIYLKEGDLDSFQKHQYRHDSIENLLVNERTLKNIQDLNAKYDTEKKMQQIGQLEQDKAIQELRLRQDRMLFVILAGIIFTILVVGFLLIRSYRQKQLILNQENEIHERRIAEFETEKQLTAIEAVLRGQDNERTRLARDLHDGLGGMLTGIKLSFMHLKETLANCLDDEQQFDRCLDMLDGSVMELRRVAHNLMPEVLLRFGLNNSVNDLCDHISRDSSLKVSYQSTGLENFNPDQTTLVMIYRIVQELLNNSLRHASAQQAFVQLDFHNNYLGITVEDNGVGFDTSRLATAPGIGWSNIRNRVQYLTGKIDIRSAPGRGTTINIDLPYQGSSL